MEESNVLIAMRKGYPCIILCDEKLGDIEMVLDYNEGKEDGISISQIADELEESEDAIKDLVKEVEK